MTMQELQVELARLGEENEALKKQVSGFTSILCSMVVAPRFRPKLRKNAVTFRGRALVQVPPGCLLEANSRPNGDVTFTISTVTQS
jgi:hypothetical protein